MSRYDVIIIGGGPAGLTAGLYTSRAGLKSLLLERGALGGQMVNATLVENYPGFPEGISGPELGSLMHQQAVRYGLEVVTAEVTGITPGQPYYSISTTEGSLEASVVIIAAGSEYRKLEVMGEERLAGRGVSYCATCDGFFFRNREVAVVGGGDTAITDALELSHHASKVYVIHRRDQLRAGKALQERAFAHPKLEFIWDMVVEEVSGDKVLEELKLRHVKTGQQSNLKVNGVFVAVGLMPNSRSFFNILELDDAGYIVTDETMATSTPGIFAAGDIRRNSPRQIAAAVGDGVTAATSAFKYVQETGNGARSRALEVLQQIGIRRGQTVLDFGCGYGAYTIPVASIVGEQGRVYALDKDKEALDELMQKAESAGLKNIERVDTSGELKIELTDESVDAVLLFDVFHSFYFPQADDRGRLLGEIYRIMKPSAILSISVWPNLIEPATEDEIKNADFRLEKEVTETLTDGNKDLGARRILCFGKAQYVPTLVIPNNQSRRRQYEQDSANHGSKF